MTRIEWRGHRLTQDECNRVLKDYRKEALDAWGRGDMEGFDQIATLKHGLEALCSQETK